MCRRDGCGKRFEYRPGEYQLIGKPNERKYCDRKCLWIVKRAKMGRNRVCIACGHAGVARTAYGLALCDIDRSIAWQSCWRKIRYAQRTDAPVVVGGEAMHVYRCGLCPGWHNSRDKDTEMPAAYERRRSLLGMHLRRISFDVIAVRGWANQVRSER